MRARLIAAVMALEVLLAIGAVIRATTNSPASPPATSRPAAPAAPVVAVVSPRGVVLPVVSREAGGWRVRTPCGGQTVLSSAKPLTTATVVLDPGHGGEDTGASGPNGLTEAELNLAVARQAKAALERSGLSVVLTRDGPYNMNLETRAAIVMGLRPRAFVSVHHNSVGVVPSPRPGTEAYYQVASPESKRLGGLLYEEVVNALSPLGGPWVAARAGAKYMVGRDGDDYLGVLRRTHGVPAALAEMAYITHASEAQLLARPETQRIEGEAIARAVQRFLKTSDPGSGFIEATPPPTNRGGGGLLCTDPQF